MGCGVGLIFTFLFWHLQDLGGSPTLFGKKLRSRRRRRSVHVDLGVASVINHSSELFAYFFLHQLIHRFGHIKILYFGLLGNCIRFVYISIISSPWSVLPVEFIQGLTHAAVWATACSYLSQAVPPNLRLSCQGILQGFHFGFGRGCGALFGGFIASYIGQSRGKGERKILRLRFSGTDITFRLYGIFCFLLVLFFIYLHKKSQQQDFLQQFAPVAESNPNGSFPVDDPHEFVGESPLLTPYGAPANAKWQRRISAELTGGIRLTPNYSSVGQVKRRSFLLEKPFFLRFSRICNKFSERRDVFLLCPHLSQSDVICRQVEKDRSRGRKKERNLLCELSLVCLTSRNGRKEKSNVVDVRRSD